MLPVTKHKIKVLRPKTSLHNVPEGLAPLITEVVAGCQEVLKTKTISVYGCGSWLRNEMRADSDVDFFIAIKGTLTGQEESSLESLRRKLVEKWHTYPIVDIEFKIVNLSDSNNYRTILRRVVIQSDGCLLYGTPISGDVVNEYPLPEIIAAFIKLFLEVIEKLDLYNKDTHIHTRARRTLAKIVFRCIEWTAVLGGAPISSGLSEYTVHIKKYSPNLKQQADYCWEVYKKTTIDASDVENLKTILHEVLDTLKQSGVKVE
jgi:predicted nucleotidyltransferase